MHACSLTNQAATIQRFVGSTIQARIAAEVTAIANSLKDQMRELVAAEMAAVAAADKAATNSLVSAIDASMATVSKLKASNDANADKLEKLQSLESVGPHISKIVASLQTTHYMDDSIPVLRKAYFHTHAGTSSWFVGNSADLFGGVNPSTWTDNNGMA